MKLPGIHSKTANSHTIKADIRTRLRYLLITSLPLRGISAGAPTPAETGKDLPKMLNYKI